MFSSGMKVFAMAMRVSMLLRRRIVLEREKLSGLAAILKKGELKKNSRVVIPQMIVLRIA
jgi:hypothetical protein